MIRERVANPKPLHNFTLPHLRWGNQIPMQCAKSADHPVLAATSSSLISVVSRRSVQRMIKRTSLAASPEEAEDGEGIEAVREKLMLDLKTETDKIRKELLKEEEDDNRVEAAAPAAAVKEGMFGSGLTNVVAAAAQCKKDRVAETRPWNLRTRRASCRAPAAKNGSPARKEGSIVGKVTSSPAKEKDREKFSLGLKRKEIEEDFMILTGHRPPRRPKKRPRAVQKQLDMLFPGSWLTEITADAYKVAEVPDGSQARRSPA
ncbi:hypothetical protein MLD38_003907 [Melastoma candidum]|uniref:Uncharacterized protein n=1 Tax=Melastoma candidum TaxID=119954 RepID=A0ACB9S3H7_9MYRT|nr:hypothetical protein MLD38_003907 [Melastoma candidum]